MKKHTVKTYTATIYLGMQIGYDGQFVSPHIPFTICKSYCNSVGLCVTMTRTTFIYKHGEEEGWAIGLINYPRFPSTKKKIRERAIELAKLLKSACEQNRVSIVFLDETIMLGEK